MPKIFIMLIAMLIFAVSPAYSVGFNGHFGDMDANHDSQVSWDEFKTFFPHATEEVFQDASGGAETIDHGAWHDFKTRNNYGHIEGKKHE